jgi:hypothetical protein
MEVLPKGAAGDGVSTYQYPARSATGRGSVACAVNLASPARLLRQYGDRGACHERDGR